MQLYTTRDMSRKKTRKRKASTKGQEKMLGKRQRKIKRKETMKIQQDELRDAFLFPLLLMLLDVFSGDWSWMSVPRQPSFEVATYDSHRTLDCCKSSLFSEGTPASAVDSEH